GDFNGDGKVDALDLAQWQGDYGLNGESDADGDGDSDGADFLLWQRNFGVGVPTPTAALSVPEPGAISTWIVGVAMAYLSSHSRVRIKQKCELNSTYTQTSWKEQ
ncbi:MAG: hypothetical protein MI725_04370, partial [Pirellulales bacterium]|nr:hypothetical protein [Pirellulales bacterium]